MNDDALNFISDDYHYVISPAERPNCQSSKEEFFRYPEVAIQTIIDALMFSCRMFGSMTDIVGQIQYCDFVYRPTIKQEAFILSALSCHIQSKQVFKFFVYYSQYYIFMSVCLFALLVCQLSMVSPKVRFLFYTLLLIRKIFIDRGLMISVGDFEPAVRRGRTVTLMAER